MNKKLKSLIIGITMSITFSQTVFADIITSVNVSSINNNNSHSTYKQSNERLDKDISNLTYNSTLVNKNYGDTYKNIQDYEERVAWLLEHDILSKDVTVTNNLFSVDFNPINYYTLDPTSGVVKKSDFLMALSKGVYGVKPSRTVAINTKSTENLVPSGDENISYDVSEGTYHLYNSSNVYELYLSDLLDKSIVSIGEIGNNDFISEYKRLKGKSKPDWFYTDSTFNSRTRFGNPLGQTLELKKEGIKTHIVHNNPTYFKSEDMLVIDGYRYIESILRKTEKDMTATEAEIISYKYGIDYLKDLSDQDKKTVMYLTALGILDFDKPEEFKDIYSALDTNFFITLIYRVSNKAARKNFSEIKLTDNDNYWLKRDFQAATLTLYSGKPSDLEFKVTEVKNTAKSDRKDNILFKRRDLQYFEGNPKFSVETVLHSQLSFGGVPVPDLKAGDGTNPKISKITSLDNNQYKIEFSVEAPSSHQATLMISNKISGSVGNNVLITLQTVAKVEEETGEIKYFLSKQAIQSLSETGVSSEIEILDDKHLINTRTQTQAVILDKDKKAIVGNRVISTSTPMVAGINGDVLYNLDIIVGLMTNAYIDKLNTSNIIEEPLYSADSNSDPTGKWQDVQPILLQAPEPNSDLRELASDFTLSSKYTHQDGESLKYMSLLHPTRVYNLLYTDVSKLMGKKFPVYMMVEWKKAVPSSTTAKDKELYGGMTVKQDNLTLGQAINMVNNPPTSGKAKDWWDSNLALSNALCNMIFGTSGKAYIASGYIAPSVTLLSDAPLTIEEQNNLMGKLKLSGDIVKRFAPNNNNRISHLFALEEHDWGSLARARTYSTYVGSLNKEAVYYGKDYVMDKTGALYRSFASFSNTSNTKAGLDKTAESIEHRSGKYYISVAPDPAVKPYFTLRQGEEVKFPGQGGSNIVEDIEVIAGKAYYVMTRKEISPYGKLCGLSGNPSNATKGKLDAEYDEYVRARNKGDDDAILTSAKLNDPKIGNNKYRMYSPGILGKLADDGTKLIVSSCVSAEGTSVGGIKTGTVSGDKVKIDGSPLSEDTEAYTTIYVSVDKFIVDPNGNMSYTPSGLPMFQATHNFVGSNMANTLIDAIALESYNTVNIYDLPADSKVKIGRYTFIKRGNSLVCPNTTDGGTITGMVAALKNTDAGQRGDAIIKALSIPLADVELVVANSVGALVPEKFLNYLIKRVDPATKKEKVSLDIGTVVDKKGIKEGDKILIYEGGKYKIATTGGKTKDVNLKELDFNKVTLSIGVTDKVLFKPLSREQQEYALVTSAQNPDFANFYDVPFFTGTLGFDWDSESVGLSNSNEYKTATDVHGMMERIQEEYRKAFAGDVYAILKLLVINILSYLCVITFVAYFAKKVSVIHTFLLMIKNPNGARGLSGGLDILKIITLGTVSLENDMSFARMFTTIGLISILLSLFLRFC